MRRRVEILCSICREIVLQGHSDDQVRHDWYLGWRLLLLQRRVLAALLFYRSGIGRGILRGSSTESMVVRMDGATLEVLVNRAT